MPVDVAKLARELKAIQDRTRKGLKPVTREEVLANIQAFRERRPELQLAPDLPVHCSECEDIGVRFVVDERGVRRAAACPCRSTRRRDPVDVFECPPKFADARLDNFTVCLETTHAVQAAREFVEGTRAHLYLNGPPGRGKTRLALSAARGRADQGEPAAFISVPWLIALAQRGIDDARKRAEAADLEDRAIETAVVVLDDLAGGEKGSDFARGILSRVVDRRYQKERSTILTSNFDLPRLAQYYDDVRIVSRIAELCGETHELGGPDRRLAPRTEPTSHGLRVVGDGKR